MKIRSNCNPENEAKLPATADRGKRRRKSRGQSFVELSLILPLLMLITLGTIDLGRMFFGYIQMTNAVREGAAVASHVPEDTAGIDAAISGHASSLPVGYTWGCPACASAETNDEIVITATWEFQPITFEFLDSFWGLGGPITMSTHSTMKVL